MLRPEATNVRATGGNVRAVQGTNVRGAYGPTRRAGSRRVVAVPRPGAVILILLPECER